MGRRKPSYLSLTDLFCGAGGASIGAEAAGLKLVLGINHWQQAIETHSANFPNAAHDCRDVSETHPSRYGSTHLLWASPECPTWSQARGKRRNFTGQLGLSEEFEPLPTEAEEKSRVTMWDVVRYAEYHDYDAVVVENVVDVMPWALLPIWYQAMEKLGYAHRTLFVNSMMFGAPQSRDRWYAVFWKSGNRTPELEYTPTAWCPACEARVEGRQSFKKPRRWTDRYGPQYLYLCPRCAGPALPFVSPALAAIDLSVRGERIGDKKKPLSVATLARIGAGIDNYWGPGARRRQRAPLYVPIITRLRGTDPGQIAGSGRPATDPLGTISAGGIHHGVVNPPLYVKMNGSEAKAGPMAHPATDPLGSLTAKGHVALVVPMDQRGPNRHNRARTVEDPLRTQGSIQADSVVSPPLVYVGRADNRSRPADEPLPTFTSGGNMGVVDPSLEVQVAGNTYDGASGSGHGYFRIRPADEHPLWAQPGTEQTAIVQPGLVVPTNGNRHGDGGERVRSIDEPLTTQTADLGRGLVTGDPRHAFVSAYYGNAVNREVDEPMPTVRGTESHALVEGPAIAVEDCYFRMLMPAEIGLGMAFPDTYQVLGRRQSEVVRQYGLAVTPPVPAWIWQRIVDSLR
jgi:DNA (cytosine-5)-methyltransferase 1